LFSFFSRSPLLLSLSFSLSLSVPPGSLPISLSLTFSLFSLFLSLQFFSIALAHFSIHSLLFQNSSHTALNRKDKMTETPYDVCRMTPPSQNLSHTHQNQTFPSKPTICAQLKMYSFIQFFHLFNNG